MAESFTRIYLVKTTKAAPGESTRLIEARNAAQALAHVVDDFLTCELASQKACAEAGAAGVKVETAGSGSDS